MLTVWIVLSYLLAVVAASLGFNEWRHHDRRAAVILWLLAGVFVLGTLP